MEVGIRKEVCNNLQVEFTSPENGRRWEERMERLILWNGGSDWGKRKSKNRFPPVGGAWRKWKEEWLLKKQLEKKDWLRDLIRTWAEDWFEKEELENKSEFCLDLKGLDLERDFQVERWRFGEKEKPFLEKVESLFGGDFESGSEWWRIKDGLRSAESDFAWNFL